MEQPSETQGKDWLSIPSTYTAVEIQLDWAEQRVLETTLFPLGLLKFQFHYLRPAGEHFLLLGARCAYRENGPDQNAWIVSRDGAVLSRFCLGDGIQDCVVKKDGTIITSYFDEGVFGNYGWDEPLGACGLIAWTSEGTPLWKNENYSIYDCYAISLDEEENLWFYYYDEFRLVRTNFKEDFVFELPIEGSGAFSVAPSGNTFLFQGGYQQRDKFYFLTAHGDRLGQKQEAMKEKHLWMKATVWSNGRRMLWLLLSSCPCRKSKEVFTVCVQAGAMSSWLRKWLRSSKSPSRPCVFGWKHAISYKFGTASPPPERGAQPHQCSQALLYAFCSQFSEHGRRRMA